MQPGTSPQVTSAAFGANGRVGRLVDLDLAPNNASTLIPVQRAGTGQG